MSMFGKEMKSRFKLYLPLYVPDFLPPPRLASSLSAQGLFAGQSCGFGTHTSSTLRG